MKVGKTLEENFKKLNAAVILPLGIVDENVAESRYGGYKLLLKRNRVLFETDFLHILFI